MAVTTRLETITPAKAQRWLDSRASNRPVSESYAKTIAAAINADEWEVNGETFKFNVDDELIDGQHRCLGVVIAGQSIQSFVTRGLNNCTFDTIDIGRKRTMGAIFAKHGEANYNRLAGAVAWLWRYSNGYVASGHQQSPRICEGMDLLDKHPGLRESVQAVNPKGLLMSPSMAACIHYLFALKDRESADLFFDRLASGESICKSNSTSGILLLRNILIQNRTANARLQNHCIWALAIKAWNAMRDRKVVKVLRYSAEHELFPQIM